jgi:hypothetical protein
MTIRKPILCLDMDGVIHSYTSGWKGADVLPDPPVPGALDFILRAMDDFKVAIYSSRSGQDGGVSAMATWLIEHMVEHFGGDRARASAVVALIDFPTEKPPALVTLDDRAVTFTGNWPGLDELLAFQPWNKRPPAENGPLLTGDQLVSLSKQIRGFVAEIDAMPAPDAMCEDATAYHRGLLLKRIADALR